MKINKISIIKRMIAFGLMAIMACVNPLQTLSPANTDGTPTTAKAAEKAPYISEIRLAVDKDAATAKQILTDAGYEVVDQDLNEKAGDFWNKLGEQAVYIGFKRTADAKDAIRDMKLMNMNGQYSYTELEEWVNENRRETRTKCEPIFKIIKEFKQSVKNEDVIALKALEYMNRIIETDSGKGVGDFLISDECGEEGVVKMILEGNSELVTSIMRLLYIGCEEKDSTWLDRLSTMTKKDLTKKYTREIYGVDTVIGEQKAEVERIMEADLYDTAEMIYENWDTLRNQLVASTDTSYTDEEKELMKDDEFFEGYMDFLTESKEFQTNELSLGLKEIPYGGKTLFDLFSLDRSIFNKDLTRLYPLAAALTEGQKALLQYISLADLTSTAISRRVSRETGTATHSEFKPDMLKECSLYAGVDRTMYLGGAAMTSRATTDFQQNKGTFGWYYACITSSVLTMGCFALTFDIWLTGLGHQAEWEALSDKLDVFCNPNDIIEKKFALPNDPDIQTAIENANGLSSSPQSNSLEANYIQDQSFADEIAKKMDKAYDKAESTLNKARVMMCISLIMLAVTTTLFIIDQKKRHNIEQLRIPTAIFDKDVESDVTGYVRYDAVCWNRNRNDDSGRDDRGDLNGDAGAQWLALYVSRDKATGDPILADSIKVMKGIKGAVRPKSGDYVPLTLFAIESVQNLVSETFSFHDRVGGIWMWYVKGTNADVLIDDRDDEYTYGSNISGGTIALIGTGCAVVGFIIGLICMFFFRRKKIVTK